MTSPTAFRHYGRIMRHFVSTRSVEVLALQASPIIGCLLGGFSFTWNNVIRLALLLLGSLALTAHVFVFNDWAGYKGDMRDPRRVNHFSRQGISRGEVAWVAVVLLIVAGVAFAMVGKPVLLLGAAIAALSFVYSCSSNAGKSTPIAASLNHLLGGSLHFLLGYTLFHSLDGAGLWISLFFGLVFAGGHLNQEVRDYEGDSVNGIRTCAVAFGKRGTFLASLCLFTFAYALIMGLAAFGVLPKLLLLSPFAWLLQVAWSLRALQRGLGFETALWMQRRYRLLFAFTGFMMLLK